MVKLRLYRVGRKKVNQFRIVAANANTKANGSYLELIGTYSPQTTTTTLQCQIDLEKANKWLNVGAKPTTTVKNLLQQSTNRQAVKE